MHLLAGHAIAHPRGWLVLVSLLTLVLGAGAARLELRTDGAALRPPADPIVVATVEDGLRFQDPRQVVLLVREREAGPPLVSVGGFRLLAELHERLRALSAVRADGLRSLAGLTRLRRGGSGFAVGTYLADVPDDPAELPGLVAELRGRALTDGLLLSPDGRLAAFYIPLSERGPASEQLAEVEDLVRSQSAGPYELLLTGPLVAETTLGRMVLRDLAVLVPAMVALIVVLLWLALGDRGGVAICMLEALIVLVWTFGIMGWAGVPVTLVTTILPVVLMTMAITDEVHLLERLKGRLAESELREAVLAAVADVRVPIVATSVTTALGFLSFLSASIEPVRQFGALTALGILLAMVLSFCWVPALIVTLPRSWFRAGTGSPRGAWLWGEPARQAVRHPGAALGLGLALVALALPGLWRLHIQDSWVGNFPSDSALARADAAYNAAFWGSYRFDVVFDAEDEYFYTPDAARWMKAFERVAAAGPHVGGVVSYLTPLEEVAAALELDEPLSSLSATQLADVVAVTEMSEGRLALRELFSDDGAAARTRLFVNSPDYLRSLELREYLEEHVPRLLPAGRVRYRVSGDLPVAEAVVGAVVTNQLRSIAWTLATVTLVLVLVYLRGRAGLLAMAPVIAAVLSLFGVMGHTGLPLGVATSMFASLAVGVGVDFAIHFLHRYRMERRSGDDATALAATAATAGRALRWNAGVLATGFLVLTLSSLGPNRSLGLLLAGAMVACYAMTVLLLPRLARWTSPLAGALVLLLASAPSAGAQSPCPHAEEADARAVMAGIEDRFRREPRIVRMHIDTTYPKSHALHDYFEKNPTPKTLWGAFGGDARETLLLYVFSGPGRLAGTTLLIHDRAGRDADDMWLYLRSFGSFTHLEPGARQVIVPGTVLTYEDARGFLPVDSYHFASREDTEGAAGRALLACPRTPAIRDALGYSALELQVDPERQLVLHVRYADLGGKPLKSWALVEPVRASERWYPGKVQMRHLGEGRITHIEYEHWPLAESPDRALFRPEVAQQSFLVRMRELLEREGHGERIGAELAEADERVRLYDERMKQREQEGGQR